MLTENPVVQWASRHPRVAAWIVLSAGMVGLIAYEAADVGLLLRQWIALIVATIGVAGLCVWIISWEDETEESAVAEANTATNESNQSGEAVATE